VERLDHFFECRRKSQKHRFHLGIINCQLALSMRWRDEPQAAGPCLGVVRPGRTEEPGLEERNSFKEVQPSQSRRAGGLFPQGCQVGVVPGEPFSDRLTGGSEKIFPSNQYTQ
jgi:hypothetical protein